MIKRFWNWALSQSSAGCAWLALHLECWRVGHDWQLDPMRAWCEHCEAEVKGERARKMYEAKYGPYVEPPPGKPWPLPMADIDVPVDTLYLLDMSKWGRLSDGSIIERDTHRVVVPPISLNVRCADS